MTDAEIDVWQALRRFLDAFENGDTDAMRSAFSDDAVTFPRAGTGDREHSTSPRFRRVRGIDLEMLRVASRLDAAEGMPNPLSIDPQDLVPAYLRSKVAEKPRAAKS